MHNSISSMMTRTWRRLRNKEYRDSFVGSHISNTIAAQIATLRAKRGWSQTKLAAEAGTHQSRISSLEDPNYENIEIGTLKKLASAFDVALTVRFVPYSELARWNAQLSTVSFNVPSFAEDEVPAQKQPAARGHERVTQASLSANPNRYTPLASLESAA